MNSGDPSATVSAGCAMVWGLLPIAFAWELGPPCDLPSPTTVEQGPVTWELVRGTLFPVRDASGIGGFVFVGTSFVRVGFARPEDGVTTANRLVALLGRDAEAVQALGRGGVLELEVDRAAVFGVDAWRTVRPRLQRVADPAAPPPRDAVLEVVVYDHGRLDHVTALAQRTLDDRLRWLDVNLVGPSDLVVSDRWDEAHGIEAPARWLASFHTTDDWGMFAGDRVQPRTPNPWLEALGDASGALVPGARAAVLAHGEGGRTWPLAVDPLPADERGRPLPDRGVDLVGAGITARLAPTWDGERATVAVAADLRVRAVGGPAGTVLLDVPRVPQAPFGNDPPQPDAWRLVEVVDEDGRTLENRITSFRARADDPVDALTVAVRLAEPLGEGSEQVLAVRWVDAGRLAHRVELGPSAEWQLASNHAVPGAITATRALPDIARGLGESTLTVRTPLTAHPYGSPLQPPPVRTVDYGSVAEPFDVLPRVRTGGTVPPVRLRVVNASDRRRHRVASSGRIVLAAEAALETVVEDGEAWVALGEWAESWEGGVRVLSRFGYEDAERRLRERLARVATPAELAGLTIAEGAAHPAGRVVKIAGQGLGWHAEHVSPAGPFTELEGQALLLLLAEQTWEGAPRLVGTNEVRRGALLAASIDGLDALHGRGASADAWARLRSRLPPGGVLSRDGEGALPATAAAWVLGRVLPAQVGEDALRDAVERVRRGERPPTWEGLAAAISEGGDPGPLAVWPGSGVLPTVDVAWRVDGGVLHAEARADLPYGRFRVPLCVDGCDGTRLDLVVVDGRGEASIPWTGAEPSVRPDPRAEGFADVRLAREPRGGGSVR